MIGKVLDARVIAGAATLVLIVLAPRHAAAIDTIIGGQAEICARDAKADIFTPEAIETCSIALTTEVLQGHLLAATYVNRGTMFIGAANYGSALKDFDEAIKAEPGLGVAYVNRGGALVGLRRYKEAEAEIDKGLALMPEEPEKAYGNRAIARWSQDNVKGAYEDFTKALELKPDWAWPKEQLTHFTVSGQAKPANPAP